MKRRFITYIVLLTSIFAFGVQAQMKERGLTRKGNEFVKDSLFVMAEAEYLKSLDIHDFDTNRFNLAFAMLGQEKFDEAIEEWKSVESTSEDKVLKSYCMYNIGGALVMQKKNDEAIEKYKQALRYFPKNDVARHNYWLLKLMKDQNPQQDQDQQNQDQNQDQQNKDQNQDQNGGQNQDQQNKDQQNQDQKDKDQQDQQDQNQNDQGEGEGDKGQENQDEQDKKSEDSEGDESDDKSDEGKDENQNESGDKSDEEKSEEEKDGSGGDEEKQDEGQQPNEELKAGELSTGDALRLLESLDKEEDKTQEKVKAKLLKGKKRKKHDKDW